MPSMIDPAVAQRLGQLVQELRRDDFTLPLQRLLMDVIPYDNIVVLVFSPDRPPESLFGSFSETDTRRYFHRHYFLGAYRLDPYYQGCLAGLPAGLYRLRDIAPDRFFQSEYHKAYYRFVGLSDEVGFLIPTGPGTWLHLSLSRQQGTAAFGQGELRRLAAFEPLLTPLLRQHWGDRTAGEAATLAPDEGLVGHILTASRTAGDRFPGNRMAGGLSRREAQVVAHVLCGHSSASIGLRLGISTDTVKVHRRKIYRKLSISSQAELFTRFIPFTSPGLVKGPAKPL